MTGDSGVIDTAKDRAGKTWIEFGIRRTPSKKNTIDFRDRITKTLNSPNSTENRLPFLWKWTLNPFVFVAVLFGVVSYKNRANRCTRSTFCFRWRVRLASQSAARLATPDRVTELGAGWRMGASGFQPSRVRLRWNDAELLRKRNSLE
jgi:hypothetical protein